MRIKQRQFEAREKERARSRESEISGATADEEEVDNGAMGVVEVPLHLRKVEGYPDTAHVRQRALVDDESTAAEAETAGLTKVRGSTGCNSIHWMVCVTTLNAARRNLVRSLVHSVVRLLVG